MFFDNLLDEVVAKCCQKVERFKAKCPLAFVDGEAGSKWCLSEGIELRIYTDRDIASYLTRTHNKFTWHEFISNLRYNTGVLEIVSNIGSTQLRQGSPPKTGADIIEEQLSDTIDIVKWALSIACHTPSPFVEGSITYEHILGGHFTISSGEVFRRENKSSATVHKLSEGVVREASELIRSAVLWQSPDLKNAFWHWGRSCVADLDRDVLLEAIIGLEPLLVPSPGESRYRFGLHGAALLCTSLDKAEEMARDLRKLYDRRSSAAHGRREEGSRDSLASRKNLADAIKVIIQLYNEGVFIPGQPIAKQIESAILKNAPLRRTI